MKEKSYSLIRDTPHGDIVRIDFMWTMEKGDILNFSINLSILEEDNKTDVYRIDTTHGYLHEHRFWKSDKSEKLDIGYNKAFIEKKKGVLKSYRKWILLFKENRGENNG